MPDPRSKWSDSWYNKTFHSQLGLQGVPIEIFFMIKDWPILFRFLSSFRSIVESYQYIKVVSVIHRILYTTPRPDGTLEIETVQV